MAVHFGGSRRTVAAGGERGARAGDWDIMCGAGRGEGAIGGCGRRLGGRLEAAHGPVAYARLVAGAVCWRAGLGWVGGYPQAGRQMRRVRALEGIGGMGRGGAHGRRTGRAVTSLLFSTSNNCLPVASIGGEYAAARAPIAGQNGRMSKQVAVMLTCKLGIRGSGLGGG